MAYDRTVKSGHIWEAVRQATDQRKGGVIHVNSTDYKSVMLVLNFL